MIFFSCGAEGAHETTPKQRAVTNDARPNENELKENELRVFKRPPEIQTNLLHSKPANRQRMTYGLRAKKEKHTGFSQGVTLHLKHANPEASEW